MGRVSPPVQVTHDVHPCMHADEVSTGASAVFAVSGTFPVIRMARTSPIVCMYLLSMSNSIATFAQSMDDIEEPIVQATHLLRV